jgi:RNA polymerase sigma-70 factor (ECF subfamily)
MGKQLNEKTRLTLIEKLSNLDDSCVWEKFFILYWGLLYNFCIRKGLNHEDAEDVIQDVVIVVVSKMPEFEYKPSKGTFRGWLYQITRRKIIDFHRKETARKEISSERISAKFKLEKDFDKNWETEWLIHVRKQATEMTLKKVTAKQFQMYDSYVNKELPVSKICEFHKVSANQVYLAKNRVGEIFRSEAEKITSGKWQD